MGQGKENDSLPSGREMAKYVAALFASGKPIELLLGTIPKERIKSEVAVAEVYIEEFLIHVVPIQPVLSQQEEVKTLPAKFLRFKAANTFILKQQGDFEAAEVLQGLNFEELVNFADVKLEKAQEELGRIPIEKGIRKVFQRNVDHWSRIQSVVRMSLNLDFLN